MMLARHDVSVFACSSQKLPHLNWFDKRAALVLVRTKSSWTIRGSYIKRRFGNSNPASKRSCLQSARKQLKARRLLVFNLQ